MTKNLIEHATIVKPFTFFFFFFLLSCDSYEVVQIKVEIPTGIQIPEKMIYIPAGDFIMGHEEEPRTRLGKLVSSAAYFIDRYEVSHIKYKNVQPNHTFSPKSALYPVTHLSYFEALDYCKALDKRLPTEIEWEKAARGTDGRKWPWRLYVDHPTTVFQVLCRSRWISARNGSVLTVFTGWDIMYGNG